MYVILLVRYQAWIAFKISSNSATSFKLKGFKGLLK